MAQQPVVSVVLSEAAFLVKSLECMMPVPKVAFVVPPVTAFAAGPGIMAHEIGRLSAASNTRDRLKILAEDTDPKMLATMGGAVLAPVLGSIGGVALGQYLVPHSEIASVAGGLGGGSLGMFLSNRLGRLHGHNTLNA